MFNPGWMMTAECDPRSILWTIAMYGFGSGGCIARTLLRRPIQMLLRKCVRHVLTRKTLPEPLGTGTRIARHHIASSKMYANLSVCVRCLRADAALPSTIIIGLI